MNSSYHKPSYAAGQPLAQNRQAFATTSTRAMPEQNSAGPYRNPYSPGGPIGSGGGMINRRPPGARTYQGSGQATPFRIPDDPRNHFWSNMNWPVPPRHPYDVPPEPHGMPFFATQPGTSSLPNGGWFQRSPLMQAFSR